MPKLWKEGKIDNKDDLNPLVSVIIPVYNRSELLARTIKSVLAQTYKNLEIIVVDDGSSESIKTIADSFNDSRIKYIRHDENKGLCTARNTGIKTATGEFMEFLDSDDEFLPEKTEKQMELFRENEKRNIGFVYCGTWIENCGILTKTGLNQPGFFKWAFLIHQVMIRSRIVEKTGWFDTVFSTVEDTDYFFRMSKICSSCGTEEPLVIYHNTCCSASKNAVSIVKHTNLFIEKHAEALMPEEKALLFKYMAKLCLRIDRITEAYKLFLKAYLSSPRNIYFLRKLIRLSPLFLFHLLKIKKGTKAQ